MALMIVTQITALLLLCRESKYFKASFLRRSTVMCIFEAGFVYSAFSSDKYCAIYFFQWPKCHCKINKDCVPLFASSLHRALVPNWRRKNGALYTENDEQNDERNTQWHAILNGHKPSKELDIAQDLNNKGTNDSAFTSCHLLYRYCISCVLVLVF